ncbi:hypothetical protein NHQ30_001985 [Ciborinia camelliae]|nr:hypothetical protein NHQ30_001985 [Ciborinia camelliae]
MRQHTSTIVVCLFCILRLTNALSLANFQSISATAVSLDCFVEYNTKISTCTLSDFKNGCSLNCQSALISKYACVNRACSADYVSSKTLLGIIKSGGILGALCPNIKTSTTATRPTSTTTLLETSTTSAEITETSTTNPMSSSTQSSSENILTTTFPELPTALSTRMESSKTRQSLPSQIPSSSSISSTSSSTSSESTSTFSSSPNSNTSTNTNTTPTTTQIQSQSQPQTQSSTSASTKTTGTTPKSTATMAAAANNGDGASGGGSPFDINADNGGLASGVGRVSRALVIGVGLVYWGLGVWILG